jgi:hypothetical protein
VTPSCLVLFLVSDLLNVFRNISDGVSPFIPPCSLLSLYAMTNATSECKKETVIKRNGRVRRNLSLTGLYKRFSDYGESIAKPTLIGVIIVGLSTLFWLMQSNPALQPTFSSNAHFLYSNFTSLANSTNSHLLRLLKEALQIFFLYFLWEVISK